MHLTIVPILSIEYISVSFLWSRFQFNYRYKWDNPTMSLHICIATMALNDLSSRDFSHVVISCLLVVPSYFLAFCCWFTWIAAAYSYHIYISWSKHLFLLFWISVLFAFNPFQLFSISTSSFKSRIRSIKISVMFFAIAGLIIPSLDICLCCLFVLILIYENTYINMLFYCFIYIVIIHIYIYIYLQGIQDSSHVSITT